MAKNEEKDLAIKIKSKYKIRSNKFQTTAKYNRNNRKKT